MVSREPQDRSAPAQTATPPREPQEQAHVAPLDVLLLALSDWVEAETTDHDSFGPRQDARVALIKAYDAWMGEP